MNEPVRYVGFWARTGAALIDLMALLFVVLPITVWLFGDGWAYGTGFAAFLVNWGIPGAVLIAFWIKRGATPGLMVFKAEVVDAQTQGRVDFWQALTRYVGYFIAVPPIFAGLAWVAIDVRKQGWHDKMARTVVVYRPR